MLDWNSIAYNQERHRDFAREAEHERLAHELTEIEDAEPVLRVPEPRHNWSLHNWVRSFHLRIPHHFHLQGH